MNESTSAEIPSAPQSASLSDLDQLWGELGQSVFADEVTRAYYLANDCPLLLPAEELLWQQPLCA